VQEGTKKGVEGKDQTNVAVEVGNPKVTGFLLEGGVAFGDKGRETCKLFYYQFGNGTKSFQHHFSLESSELTSFSFWMEGGSRS